MSTIFRLGACYVATPHLEGAKQRLFVVAARSRGSVTFAMLRDVYRAQVRPIEGRETARVSADDGLDYFISSAVEADVGQAAGN